LRRGKEGKGVCVSMEVQKKELTFFAISFFEAGEVTDDKENSLIR
jgi:hypothetical protein